MGDDFGRPAAVVAVGEPINLEHENVTLIDPNGVTLCRGERLQTVTVYIETRRERLKRGLREAA